MCSFEKEIVVCEKTTIHHASYRLRTLGLTLRMRPVVHVPSIAHICWDIHAVLSWRLDLAAYDIA